MMQSVATVLQVHVSQGVSRKEFLLSDAYMFGLSDGTSAPFAAPFSIEQTYE